MSNLRKIEGGRPHLDVAEEMADRVRDVINDYADQGVSLCLAVGVLESVKFELMTEAME